MEIIQPSCSDLRTRFLHQPPPSSPPFLHFIPSLRHFSSSITCYHHRRFHKSLPTSLVSLPLLNNLRPLVSSFKTLTTTTPYSLPDDDFSGFVTKDAAKDPAFPVMKKAVDVVHELKGASIFLVGIHSTMKAGVGELLAEVLGYYYFDSDDVVEEAAGSESVGKSFRERDEEGFRESETEVLKQLSAMGRLVVCAGNGAVQSITNLALLKYGITVWIDVPLDMVARDVIEHESQFSSSEITSSGSYSEVLNQLTVLYEENKDGYAEADVAVSLLKVATQLGYDDLAAVTKEDMSLQILKELEKSTRVRKMKEEAARPF
ncbi:probable inactive shikimate kinase like 1, chloroplastic [Rhododendron vialii]|uniref:probable inactive shikimate kinase like 1, chloroplastic n=1 Tax=Rhododendron vialii TaxID=182163 RepID=UPI00265F74BC|nr:probable inactive shikimate kinase like 1, chloroplastic [Rhododendron vialii]